MNSGCQEGRDPEEKNTKYPETNGNIPTDINLGLTNSDASLVLVLSDFERFLTFLSFCHKPHGQQNNLSSRKSEQVSTALSFKIQPLSSELFLSSLGILIFRIV